MFKKQFDDETIEAVWCKGRVVQGYGSDVWRKDNECGAWIKREEYGNRNSKYGWEIDHINPSGSDNVENLQPLQWENNVAKSDSQNGRWTCVVVG